MRCVFLLCLFLTTVQGCNNWIFGWFTQTQQEPNEVLDSRNEDVPKQVTNKGVVITLHTTLKERKGMVRDNLVGEVVVGKNHNRLKLHMDITSPMVTLLTKGATDVCPEIDARHRDGFRYTTYNKDFSDTRRSTGQSQTTPLTVGNLEVVTGVYATEQFKFNGEGSRTIVIEDQEFLEADKIIRPCPVYDGVFGLALMTGDRRSQAAPVHNMVKQFTDPVFGIHVNRISSPRYKDVVGSLILGGGDENFYKTGTLHSHDVISKANKRYDGWYIRIQRVNIKAKTENRFEGRVAIPAPHVKYVLLPEEIKKTFFERVSKSITVPLKENFVPCDTNWSELPKLVFSIDDQEYTLTAEDYVRKIQFEGEDEQCELFIGSHPQVIHLGRPFMKKFYTRFDVNNKQVQFAESNPK